MRKLNFSLKDTIKSNFSSVQWDYLLLSIYILFFHVRILNLPLLRYKLQPQDIILITLLIRQFIFKWQIIKIYSLTNIDKAVSLWFIVHIVTMLVNPQKASYLECIGTGYLVGLYFTIQIILYSIRGKEVLHFFNRYFLISVGIISVVGVIGVVLASLNMKVDALVSYFPNYPYFGNVYRASAYTGHPAMLSSITGLGLIIFLFEGINSSIEKLLFFFILTAFLLTLSKTFLILTSCFSILYLLANKIKYKSIIISLILIITSIIYLIATNFVVTSGNEFVRNRHQFYEHLNSEPSFIIGGYEFIQTAYGQLKQKAISCIMDEPIFGVGPGCFSATPYSPEITYVFSKDLDPHSSFLGSFAEMGILGFGAFCFLFYFLISQSYSIYIKAIDTNIKHIASIFLVIFVFMIFESIATDVMNFRQYWLIISFFSIYSSSVTNPSHSTV